MSASPDAASSSVCAMSRTTRLVFAETLDERLDLGQRFRVLPEFGRIALHLGRAEQLQQLVVLPLDRRQFIEHFIHCTLTAEPATSRRAQDDPESLGSRFCQLQRPTLPIPAAETRPRRRRAAR